MSTDNRYLHLIRQDCPLPPGTHVVIYCRDSGGEEQDRSVTQQIDTAREYCRHHNLVLDRLYIDESKLSSNTENAMRCKNCFPIYAAVSSKSMIATSVRKPLMRNHSV